MADGGCFELAKKVLSMMWWCQFNATQYFMVMVSVGINKENCVKFEMLTDVVAVN